MVARERVTWAVMLVLIGVSGWYGSQVWESGLGGVGQEALILAVAAIVILTIVASAISASLGANSGRNSDERDMRVAMRAQALRGFFYVALAFAVVAVAVRAGDMALANALFLAILGIEIVSGLAMAILYRTTS